MERKNRQGKSSTASTPGSGPKKPAGSRRVGTGRSTSRTTKPTENREGSEDEMPLRGKTSKERTFSADKPGERKETISRPEKDSGRSGSYKDYKARADSDAVNEGDRPQKKAYPKKTSVRPSDSRDRKSSSFKPEREGSRTGTRRDFKPRPAADAGVEGETPKKEGYPRKSSFNSSESRERKPSTFKPGKSGGSGSFRKDFKSGKPAPKFPAKKGATPQSADDGLIRLNKYIANSGVCSRREADELILAGVVQVNGKVVTELGTKISPDDKVQYDNQTIRNEKHVYVLLNKPKGYITTTDDPFDRKTVMALVADACKERIYPVGRLDRNTTGLLLLTNDGDIAKKLTHPKHKVKKVYQVELDKALTKNDMLKIADGVELEDGLALIDEIAYISDSSSKKEIGVELHSGKNRIVRRIFEATGYEVVKLDRVIFAGLTKKDLPRGKWRLLTEQEINFLKMLR